MASISSTNSSSSLGNTSLRGFGGMASGIDRDAIIEKMTLGTTTKINNQKKKVTELEWKQEAYRGITDKILDWSDTYASYASDKNLKDPTIFSKSQITLHGKEDSKSMLTVNGSSDLIDSLSILAVKQTASAAVRQSQYQSSNVGLEMKFESLSATAYTPKLGDGAKLIFESTTTNSEGKRATVEFELKGTYQKKLEDGTEQKTAINYTPQTDEEYQELVNALNKLAEDSGAGFKMSDTNTVQIKAVIEFSLDKDSNGKNVIKINQKADSGVTGYQIKGNYASEAFGYKGNVTLDKLNTTSPTAFSESGMTAKPTLDAMAGEKLVFNYNGSQKSIELITREEANAIKGMTVGDNFLTGLSTNGQSIAGTAGITESSHLSDLQNALNRRLDEINTTLGKPDELNKSIAGVQGFLDKETAKIKELNDKLDADNALAEGAEGKLSEADKENLVAEIQQHTDEVTRLTNEKSRLETELEEANNALKDDKKEELLSEKNDIESDLAKVSGAQLSKVNIQSRLDQAFGKGSVTVNTDNGKLSFRTPPTEGGASATISVMSNNTSLLQTLGIEYGASNKINVDGKLTQDALLGKDADWSQYKNGNELDLVINGVQIKGLTTDSSISDIMKKINSTKEAGVKATYVDATGQFMLVASETGKGRAITLGRTITNADGTKTIENEKITVNADGTVTSNASEEVKKGLAWKLFGGDTTKGASSTNGENAQVVVSYGQGVNVTLERASNTFNLEGLNVTVSGTFGLDDSGNVKSGEGVTFSAKADVDGALERVKKFIEDYNALVTEINTQVTTRPDSKYGALTDEQKDEMDETSIENWEKKAKQGILYGDSAMRDLSMDVQSIFTKMMNNGASYEDLKEIGISYAEDWGDGGTLVFDESKFKAAMENDPDKVSNIFTGGGNVKKGLIDTIEETFTPYATRYARKNGNGGKGSYGRLIEMAGTEKKPSTLLDNEIYKQLKEMQETIDKLQEQLQVEQDRYISQFTTMESLLNQMNTQSSYLSQLTA